MNQGIYCSELDYLFVFIFLTFKISEKRCSLLFIKTLTKFAYLALTNVYIMKLVKSIDKLLKQFYFLPNRKFTFLQADAFLED